MQNKAVQNETVQNNVVPRVIALFAMSGRCEVRTSTKVGCPRCLAFGHLGSLPAWSGSPPRNQATIASWSCDPSANGFMMAADETDYILGPGGEQVTEMAEMTDGKSCAPTPTEHHFTGKERDTESGNDYFGARYYSSDMGRFLSPDPKIGSAHAANPQSWNRYSYSLNNPLKYIDPDGKEAILFYRPPDPQMSSTKDFGHVFIYVRNDKTGRAGFFDYYPAPGKSAVHREVPSSRIAKHAALIIESTPEAEDKMLDKMDALTKQNPQFNAGQGSWLDALWNVFVKKDVNDCITTTEQILDAGGIQDSSSTPTGLWEDMYSAFSDDPDLDSDFGSIGQLRPNVNSMYGHAKSGSDQSRKNLQEELARQCALGNKAACD